jgi:hypothetical protein
MQQLTGPVVRVLGELLVQVVPVVLLVLGCPEPPLAWPISTVFFLDGVP